MTDFLIRSKKLILLIGDISILYFSLWLTLKLRFGWNVSDSTIVGNFYLFTMAFFVWLIIFYIADFYDLKSSYNNTNLIQNLLKTFTINGIITVILFYFLSGLFVEIKPQRILIIELAVSGTLIFFWRKIFFNLSQSQIYNNVLIIGENPLVSLLETEIKNRPQLGYKATVLSQQPEDLKQFCLDHKINTIVSAANLNKDEQLSRNIFSCLSLGIDVYNIATFYEKITTKIPVEFIEHSWFLDNLAENSKRAYEVIKRAMDILLSLIGLAFAALLTPIIALIIKLDSQGPIVFKQIRTGKNGKQFLAMKFRSMFTDAEKNGPQWAQKNDNRITRFGTIMRKTRIDEIPQLVNILKGEMSFVGPRPERPEFIKILSREIPFYEERLLAKPGLTGWAQLVGPSYGGSKEESLEKLKYDLYYIKNRGFLLDLSIILKTLKVVFSGKGQ